MKQMVRGIRIPELNDVQAKMFNMFCEDQIGDDDRVDHVSLDDDPHSVYVTVSTFIQVQVQGRSDQPVTHLQITKDWHLWNNTDDDGEPYEDEDGMIFDPYSDWESCRYREVQLDSIYRTLEGDSGWNARGHADDYDLLVW